MNGIPLKTVCSLLYLSLASLPAIEISNLEGTVIDVEILQTEPNRIQIRMPNGQVTWLERNRLSAETKQMLAAKEAAEQDAFNAMNDFLGIPLLADGSLWDD